MLSSYKVLDLADQRGMFCSYILAHPGAEVIALEPPGGSSVNGQSEQYGKLFCYVAPGPGVVQMTWVALNDSICASL